MSSRSKPSVDQEEMVENYKAMMDRGEAVPPKPEFKKLPLASEDWEPDGVVS